MARTPFKLKSGNRTNFKGMGSSPCLDCGNKLEDGRAKSSTFQKSTRSPVRKEPTGWKEVWDPATKTYKKVKKGETTTTTTTTSQRGTASRVKPHVSTWAEACKGKTSGMSADGKWDCSRAKDFDPSSEVETKPISKEETDVDVKTEKKKCSCPSLSAYHGVEKGQMLEYPCDGTKPAGCSKKPEETIPGPKTCSCTPKGGKPISYPCDEEKPAACRTRGESKNPDCPPSRKETCGKNQMWSWEKCRCIKTKKTKTKRIRVKKKCYKSKRGQTICPNLGVSGPKGGGRTM